MHSDETIERQKQQIMELDADLQVKMRENKMLKFRSLFETPAREKRTGSIVAHSARAGLAGHRSITKTSEALKKMLEPQPSRNGKQGHAVNESLDLR